MSREEEIAHLKAQIQAHSDELAQLIAGGAGETQRQAISARIEFLRFQLDTLLERPERPGSA
ncbi:MAG: hypothetical protein ACRED9_12430 [Caulobacteraceae bacterium]